MAFYLQFCAAFYNGNTSGDSNVLITELGPSKQEAYQMKNTFRNGDMDLIKKGIVIAAPATPTKKKMSIPGLPIQGPKHEFNWRAQLSRDAVNVIATNLTKAFAAKYSPADARKLRHFILDRITQQTYHSEDGDEFTISSDDHQRENSGPSNNFNVLLCLERPGEENQWRNIEDKDMLCQ